MAYCLISKLQKRKQTQQWVTYITSASVAIADAVIYACVLGMFWCLTHFRWLC